MLGERSRQVSRNSRWKTCRFGTVMQLAGADIRYAGKRERRNGQSCATEWMRFIRSTAQAIRCAFLILIDD